MFFLEFFNFLPAKNKLRYCCSQIIFSHFKLQTCKYYITFTEKIRSSNLISPSPSGRITYQSEQRLHFPFQICVIYKLHLNWLMMMSPSTFGIQSTLLSSDILFTEWSPGTKVPIRFRHFKMYI